MRKKDLTVRTTAGEKFTNGDHYALAHLVYRRFGRDLRAAAAAWRRLLQNSCPDEDFRALVNPYSDSD